MFHQRDRNSVIKVLLNPLITTTQYYLLTYKSLYVIASLLANRRRHSHLITYVRLCVIFDEIHEMI